MIGNMWAPPDSVVSLDWVISRIDGMRSKGVDAKMNVVVIDARFHIQTCEVAGAKALSRAL